MKIFALVAIIVISFGFLSIPDIPAIELHPDHTTFYQENLCSFSIFDLLSQDYGTFNIEIYNEPSGSVECFGKNSWYEYQPEKRIEYGWDYDEPDKIKIWISSNINLDLVIQSIFWLLLISFVPKKDPKTISNKWLISLINTLIFYIHLIGEKSYYKNLSREYDIEIFSREFNGDLYIENYFLYLYLITLFSISYIFLHLFENRLGSLINFLPYVFLIYGTYTSLNLNIYLIIFSTLGIYSLVSFNFSKKLTAVYFLFSLFWLLHLEQKDLNFDVDKLRGFINSSQSLTSLLFWILVFYLIINGVYFFINESKKFYNISKFRRHLLISSSLIFLFGNLAAVNKMVNYFSFYFLGLNKFGMRNLESISGNTWRGIAPSAEGMGEFFGFVILFTLLISFDKKIKLNIFEIFLLIITLFGIARTNNFAAISSCIAIIAFYLSFNKFGTRKTIIIFLALFIGLSSTLYLQFFRDYSYVYLSSSAIYEGVQASEIDYDMGTNQDGFTQAEQANYQYLLEIPPEEANFSSSLRNMMENYTYGMNIKYLPSMVSVFNIGSKFINRSEKWGIFFAKYNPSVSEFLFGYGPYQLTNYYFDHPTKYNYGLFLPHSSLFNYLIFFGLFGVLLILFLVYKNINISKKDSLWIYFIVFLFLNFLKSDSLLYIPNVILSLTIINYYLFKDDKDIIN